MSLAMRYLARWDCPAAQMERHLRRHGASSLQAAQTVGRLTDLHYLDDRAYAERWLARRLARRPMGLERLRFELLAKGVAVSIVDDAVNDTLREVSEEVLARRAIGAVQRKGRRLTAERIQRFLRQRGFEDATISRMIGWVGDTEDGRHDD